MGCYEKNVLLAKPITAVYMRQSAGFVISFLVIFCYSDKEAYCSFIIGQCFSSFVQAV